MLEMVPILQQYIIICAIFAFTGLEGMHLKTAKVTLVAFYHVNYPAVTHRIHTDSLFTCITHCMQSHGCYYIIVAMKTELHYICDITSVLEEFGLVFQNEEELDWKVYSLV